MRVRGRRINVKVCLMSDRERPAGCSIRTKYGGARVGSVRQAIVFRRRDVPDLLELSELDPLRQELTPALFDPPYANSTSAKPFWLHTTNFAVPGSQRAAWRDTKGQYRLDDLGRMPEGFL